MSRYYECEHGRMCVKGPNERLNEAIDLMKKAAHIFNDVHESFDGITVKNIVTWSGSTCARLKVE